MTAIGSYEVLGELGRGGMGVVLRARAPDGSTVAVKLLLDARAKDAVARFDRERRLQGTLGEAEGFVPLLDAGLAQQGPYLVMPFLGGGTLRDRLKSGVLPIAEVVSLGRSLGAALGRAHVRGIVHRDLKPENVLFTDDGRPLIADLGLAKHFREDVTGASQSVSLTQDGAGRGTVGYMPPEQAFGAKTVGPAADVYALGAILHEALTGGRMFEGMSVHEQIGRVVSGDVPSPRVARPDCPAWLARFVVRALGPEPANRPADGAAFVRELDLAAAGGDGGGAWPVLAGGLAAVLLLAALAVALGGGPAADDGAATVASGTPGTAALASSGPTAGPTPSALALGLSPTDPELRHLCSGFLDTPHLHLAAVLGDPVWRLRNGIDDLALLPGERVALASGQDGGLMLLDLTTGRDLHALTGHTLNLDVTSVAVSRDGRLALSGSADKSAILWSLATDPPAILTVEPHGGPVRAVAFSPDGTHAATAGDDALVRLWKVSRDGTGPARLEPAGRLTGHAGAVNGIAYSPEGDVLVSAGADKTLGVWDVASGRRRSVLSGHTAAVGAVAFLRERPAVLSTGDDGTLVLWDLERAAAVTSMTLGRKASALAVSPDGRTATVGLDDGWVTSVDLARMEERWSRRRHWNEVTAVRYSRDGERLFTASRDTNVKLWDPEKGEELAASKAVPGHRDWVKGLAFSADGRQLLTGSDDERIILWDLPTPGHPAREVVRLEGTEGRVNAVAFALDGKSAVSGGDDKLVRLWDLVTGKEVVALAGHTDRVNCMDVSRDGRLAATGGRDDTVRIWDLVGRGEAAAASLGKDWVNGVAFAPDRRVAAAGGEGDLSLWVPNGGVDPIERLKAGKSALAVTVSPDGQRALSGNAEGGVTLWDLHAKVALLSLEGHRAQVTGLAFTPDGARAVTAARDLTLRLWDLGRAPATPPARGTAPGKAVELERVDLASAADYPVGLAISPDGRSIAVGTGRGLVLWFAFKD